MKVLHVNTHNTGGAAKACLRTHMALLSQGIDSKVLLRSKTQEDVPHVHEIWEGLSYAAKSKKYLEQKKLDRQQNKIRKELISAKELFSFPFSIWDITSHPLYEWADIIHLHWVAGFLDYPSFFKANSKKIVWTIHDEEPFSEGFHYHYNLHEHLGKDYMKQHIAVKKKAFENQAIQVISPSSYLNIKAKKSELFSHFSHHVVANCFNRTISSIDRNACREHLQIPQNKKVVLYVADDFRVPRKGFNVMEQAWISAFSSTMILCVLGSPSIKTNAEKGILSLGRLNNDSSMMQAYSAADLLVVPSLIDNFPNTVVEASCCGTPTLGFNAGGIPEMINDVNGAICEATSEDLAKSIPYMLNQDWDRNLIQNQAKEKYSSKLAANKLIEIYSGL